MFKIILSAFSFNTELDPYLDVTNHLTNTLKLNCYDITESVTILDLDFKMFILQESHSHLSEY